MAKDEKPIHEVDLTLVPMDDLLSELKARHDEIVILGRMDRSKTEEEETWDHKGSHSQVAGLLQQATVYWDQEMIDRWQEKLMEEADDEDKEVDEETPD